MYDKDQKRPIPWCQVNEVDEEQAKCDVATETRLNQSFLNGVNIATSPNPNLRCLLHNFPKATEEASQSG